MYNSDTGLTGQSITPTRLYALGINRPRLEFRIEVKVRVTGWGYIR